MLSPLLSFSLSVSLCLAVDLSVSTRQYYLYLLVEWFHKLIYWEMISFAYSMPVSTVLAVNTVWVTRKLNIIPSSLNRTLASICWLYNHQIQRVCKNRGKPSQRVFMDTMNAVGLFSLIRWDPTFLKNRKIWDTKSNSNM